MTDDELTALSMMAEAGILKCNDNASRWWRGEYGLPDQQDERVKYWKRIASTINPLVKKIKTNLSHSKKG